MHTAHETLISASGIVQIQYLFTFADETSEPQSLFDGDTKDDAQDDDLLTFRNPGGGTLTTSLLQKGGE